MIEIVLNLFSIKVIYNNRKYEEREEGETEGGKILLRKFKLFQEYEVNEKHPLTPVSWYINTNQRVQDASHCFLPPPSRVGGGHFFPISIQQQLKRKKVEVNLSEKKK